MTGSDEIDLPGLTAGMYAPLTCNWQFGMVQLADGTKLAVITIRDATGAKIVTINGAFAEQVGQSIIELGKAVAGPSLITPPSAGKLVGLDGQPISMPPPAGSSADVTEPATACPYCGAGPDEPCNNDISHVPGAAQDEAPSGD